MNDLDLYCAIVADIKNSKEMENSTRTEVQKTLIAITKEFNMKYQKELAVPIDISAGDQIQALFHSPNQAYDFACVFREELFPICFRIGLGLGEWSVRVYGESTNKQDGTSYHNARKAFEKAHKNEQGIVFFSENKIDSIINVLIGNEDRIFNEQTNIQKQIARSYCISHPIDGKLEKDSFGIYTVLYEKGYHKTVAEEMQTTRQNISQQIKRGKVYEQRELKSSVSILMDLYFSCKGCNKK